MLYIISGTHFKQSGSSSSENEDRRLGHLSILHSRHLSRSEARSKVVQHIRSTAEDKAKAYCVRDAGTGSNGCHANRAGQSGYCIGSEHSRCLATKLDTSSIVNVIYGSGLKCNMSFRINHLMTSVDNTNAELLAAHQNGRDMSAA